MLLACLVGFASCEPRRPAVVVPVNGIWGHPSIHGLTEELATDTANAALYFERGQAFHKLREDSLALIDFKKAVSLDSTKSPYFSAIGDLLFEHKDIDASAVWLEAALRLNPDDPTARLKMAKLAIYTRDYNSAFLQINTVLRKNRNNTEGYFLKGMIRKDLKDTNQAISAFQTALQIDPTYRDAAIQLGLLYSGRHDANALKYLENAYQLDTTDVFPLYARGMFQQDVANWEAAKKEFKRATAHDKFYADAWFGQGFILMQQDSLDLAHALFTKAVQAAPGYAEAYYNRGLCSELLGRPEDALADYRSALKYNGEYAAAETALKRLGKGRVP